MPAVKTAWVQAFPQRRADWGISTDEVARLTGVEYRRLHHWMRNGVFGPRLDPGQGHRLRWDPDVVPLVRILRSLSQALSPNVRNGIPVDLLRAIVIAHEEGRNSISPGPGIILAWEKR